MKNSLCCLEAADDTFDGVLAVFLTSKNCSFSSLSESVPLLLVRLSFPSVVPSLCAVQIF